MWEAIFKFLFKYPPVAYSRGRLTLASEWPGWALVVVVLLAAVVVGFYLWKLQPRLSPRQRLLVWSLQSLVLAVLLLLLWRPSLVVSIMVPQRNVLAVLVDDSASMAMADNGSRRVDQVRKVLDDSGPLLQQLRDKFQVRLYRFSSDVTRIASAADLKAAGPSSHLEESLAEIHSELRHLPLAGVVVASDGAQNGPGASPEALEELKARQIPIYTLGVGREEFARDLQIDDVAMPSTALPDSSVVATVTVRQRGYLGQSARLEVREGANVLKTREVRFGPAAVQTVPLNFIPKTKGLREYTVSIEPLSGEAIPENNSQSRLIEVQERTAKILYVEGEPRWEYKFLRRALEEDSNLRLVSLLRTSANKFYRQGIENEQELAEGLPGRKELFKYDGLIVGSINASFFSPQQQEDIYAFVSRRGGGALFLGGREALGDGGYQSSSLADLLPVQLENPGRSASFQRKPVKFQLTPRGLERLQLTADEESNREGWQKLPPLGTYQILGEPKPGAVVLAEAVAPEGRHYPVLAFQRFGRGRGMVFATDGSWRWRMEMDATNRSHETFWKQILHFLVNDTPAPVSISAGKTLYMDEQRVDLVAQVHDENSEPVNGAAVVATIFPPDGTTQELPLQPSTAEDGIFRGTWEAKPAGVYRVEVAARLGDREIGKSASYFQRADGLLEFFSPEQNVPLLTRLAEQTGGRYYPLEKTGALPEQLTYSPAGVTVPEVRDLWDMPAWFLLLFLLKGTEWVLRKRWRTI